MSSVLPETLEVQLAKQEQRINRIREAKDLEREWSKEILDLYKQYQLQRQKQEEYLEIIEMYKNLIKEIDCLQKTREQIIKSREQAEIDKEREKLLMEEYSEKMKQKQIQFNIFMKQKGKEAFDYLKKMNNLKKELEEEIHRYEKKKKVKNEENIKSKEIIDKYREEEEKKRNEEMQNYKEGTMNVLYKITTPFHNNGNKIDYSTTRFHNIIVMKHDDNNNIEKDLNLNAYQKAEIEREKSAERKTQKEKKLKEFQENEEKNYKEIIRKAKAKENLDRLNLEFDKFNKEKRKNNKGSNGKINLNANMINAKSNDKKADYYLNKLLEKEKTNRTKVLKKQGCPAEIMQNMDHSTANEDSMRKFYEEDSILNQNEDYLSRQMKEYNEELEKINEKFFFEEPISRDPKPLKDKIFRVNPVDINTYHKSIKTEDYNVVHKEPLVPMSSYKKKLATNASVRESQLLESSIINNQSQDISRFSIIDMLNISKKDINLDNNKEKENKKVVKDFMSKINAGNKKKSVLEPIMETKGGVADVSQWNIEEEVDGPQSSSLGRRKSVKDNKNNINKKEEIKKDDDKEDKKEDKKEEKKEEKKDDKWKYSKDELFERKKKMLKDKSNFQKK